MTSIKQITFYMTALSATVVYGGCATDEVGPPIEDTSEAASPLDVDCEFGANGFIDISDSRSGTVQRSASLGFGVTISVQSGTVSGLQRGWAKISGDTIVDDQIRMDWTIDAGAHIKVLCGPFSVGGLSQSKTSAAKTTSSSSSWQFRACGRLAGVTPYTCTSWW